MSLSLILHSLQMICLGVRFLEFILLHILLASWIWDLLSESNVRKFWVSIALNDFSFLSLWDSYYAYVIPLVVVSQSLDSLLYFFQYLFSLLFKDSILELRDSLTSNVYSTLINLSKTFFISVIVFLISSTFIFVLS